VGVTTGKPEAPARLGHQRIYGWWHPQYGMLTYLCLIATQLYYGIFSILVHAQIGGATALGACALSQVRSIVSTNFIRPTLIETDRGNGPMTSGQPAFACGANSDGPSGGPKDERGPTNFGGPLGSQYFFVGQVC
jgi:hypothetical protein